MDKKTFSGSTAEEIIQQLSADLKNEATVFQYRALLQQENRAVLLDIDIDPGGGFEGGYATTRFTAPVPPGSFQFSIHEEGLFADVGKLLGMEDVQIGYPEFDEKVIIKTNDAEKVKHIFSDAAARQVFARLSDFTFGTTANDAADDEINTAPQLLELEIEDGITDPEELRQLYMAYYAVLQKLQQTAS